MDIAYIAVAGGSLAIGVVGAFSMARRGMVHKDACEKCKGGLDESIKTVHKYVSDTHKKVDQTSKDVSRILGIMEGRSQV
jgi:hypothetical protein